MFLYRLYDADDQLLYVGITGNLEARLQGHSNYQSWWPQVARHTAEPVAFADARALERRAIYDENPAFNRVGAKRTFSRKADVQDEWGQRLIVAREAAGLTQVELAERLSVIHKSVVRWEAVGRGADGRRPSWKQQPRIGEALGVSVTWLFPRDDREAELADRFCAPTWTKRAVR